MGEREKREREDNIKMDPKVSKKKIKKMSYGKGFRMDPNEDGREETLNEKD